MKRILVLALALILAVSSLAVPSYAAENDFNPGVINVFDYAMPNNDDSYIITANSSGTAYATFTMPFESSYYYADLVFSTSDNSLAVYWLSPSYPVLTIESIGNVGSDYLYRAYGVVSAESISDISIRFNYLNSGDLIKFHSFHVSSVPVGNDYGFFCDADGFISAGGYWVDFNYSAGDRPGSGTIGLGDAESTSFSGGVRVSDWSKYDYLDFSLSLYGVSTITSLSAYLVSSDGDTVGTFLDLQYSYINDSFYNDGSYEIVLRVDLSNLDRGSGNDLLIRADGEHNYQELAFYINNVKGYIDADSIDVNTWWLRKIYYGLLDSLGEVKLAIQTLQKGLSEWINSNLISRIDAFSSAVAIAINNQNERINVFRDAIGVWFNNLQNHLTSQFDRLVSILDSSGDNDGFQNQVDDQGDKLDDMQDVMDSVTQPALDSIDTDLSGIVSADDTSNIANVYTMVIGDSFVPQIMTMVVVMAMMSFALFGKR